MSVIIHKEKYQIKLLVILVINILQPVLRSVISKELKSYTKPTTGLPIILKELIEEKKVIKEGVHYRVTAIGRKSIVPSKGRFIRDINRMEYLVNCTKQRGGSD